MTDLNSDDLQPATPNAPQTNADPADPHDPTPETASADSTWDETAGDPRESRDAPTRSGFVAIVGKPNVGKSTLLNTMLGVKVAPITPKPQTTRRGVRGIYTEEGRQLVFVDTPGLHRGRTALDSFMSREIRAAVVDVEAILWVVDLRRPPNDEDKETARFLMGLPPGTPVYLIGNKLDAAKYPDEALRLYQGLHGDLDRVVSLSALNDPEAVYELREELLDRMPEAPFYYPANIRSDQSREQWAAELIRESAMIHLRQELPYTVAVTVTEWDEGEHDDETDEPDGRDRPRGERSSPNADEEPIYIAAEIWVERSNHRPIVIGKGGRMIKEIGRTARKQLQVFLDRQIYLDLEVVVRSDWREDDEALRELGYE